MTQHYTTRQGMDSELLREQPAGYLVRVSDANDNEHHVLVTHDGEIGDHNCDALAGVAVEELPDQERDIVQQVYNQATHCVQAATDEDIVPLPWRPSFLEDCLSVFQACPPADFAAFEPFYDALQSPAVDIPRERVYVVFQPVELTESVDAIDSVGRRRYLVETDAGEYEWTGPEDPYHLALHLPLYSFEWAFEERFQEFLVHHLRCQIRDAYINRGDVPPEEFQVEGFGKVNFAGEHLVDE